MKVAKTILLFSLLIPLSLFVAAVQGFSSETIEGVKKDYSAFKQSMEEKIQALEKQIKEMKEETLKNGSVKKNEFLQEIEAARDELREKFRALEKDGKERFETARKSFSDALSRLSAKVQKARSSQKSTDKSQSE